jgi:bifunctional DNA-binding transcriptional regulator/antitoxin component of YhaV-PrlF toxin-antitoxin module
MTSRVDRRGRITIDRAAREALGVVPGMLAYQRVVAGRLEVLFLPGPHRRSLYGALYRAGEPPRVLTGDQLEEAVMEAIAAEEQEGEQH